MLLYIIFIMDFDFYPAMKGCTPGNQIAGLSPPLSRGRHPNTPNEDTYRNRSKALAKQGNRMPFQLPQYA